MPIMDGLEAANILLAREDFITPIVAVTANVMPTDISQVKQAGMVDYLAKPIDIECLKKRLKNWLC